MAELDAGLGGVGAVLTKKYGPLPGWAWALAMGGAGYLLLTRIKPTASRTTAVAPGTTPSSTGFDPSSYDIGFTSGAGYYGQQPAATTAGQPTATSPAAFPEYGAWLRQAYSGQRPDLKQAIDRQQWTSLLGQYTKEETAYYQQHGTGGYGVGGGRSVGFRTANPLHAMNYWHPALRQRVKYPHYVRALGTGGAEISRISQASGVHPARLEILNPNLSPGGMARVA